jgi:hypothetical protein
MSGLYKLTGEIVWKQDRPAGGKLCLSQHRDGYWQDAVLAGCENLSAHQEEVLDCWDARREAFSMP